VECIGSTSTYDELDRLVSTTDARGVTITNTYDKIGRKKATYQGDEKTGTQLPRGPTTRSPRASCTPSPGYVSGNKYEVRTPSLDALYRPLETRYVIPKADIGNEIGGLDRFFTVYNTDGTVQSTSHPAVGGLPAEAVTYTYDALQRITRVAGKNTYATEMVYAQTGELLNAELNTGGRKAWATASYEQGTKRLLTSASLARPSSHRAGRPTAPRSTTSTRSTPTTRWVMSSRSRTPRRRGSATSSASSTTICAG
jgi:YD repeat-containing protein